GGELKRGGSVSDGFVLPSLTLPPRAPVADAPGSPFTLWAAEPPSCGVPTTGTPEVPAASRPPRPAPAQPPPAASCFGAGFGAGFAAVSGPGPALAPGLATAYWCSCSYYFVSRSPAC